jgi:hypothetical protein
VRYSTYLRRALALLIAAISLYLVLPSLAAVFSSAGSLTHLDWPWVVAAALCEGASFVAIWQLDRIAQHTRGLVRGRDRAACRQRGGPDRSRRRRDGDRIQRLDAAPCGCRLR